MISINNEILNNQQIEKLLNLLDSTDFNGVDVDKDVSLIEHGFVYDSRTNILICTHPSYVWNQTIEEEIKFAVSVLSMDKVNSIFRENKDIIVDDILTEEVYYQMCDEYKINEIENRTGLIGFRSIIMSLSFNDLVSYLNDYILKF